MPKPTLPLLLLLTIILTLAWSLKLPHTHAHRINFDQNQQRYCIQELNKVLTNANGTLSSGEGFMESCKNSHVFKGERNGIILSAECPDEKGDFHSSTKFFQIPPKPCKYNKF